MNLKNVLRAYSLLRQLGDEESAMLEILRQTNETERALLVETLSDKPSQKKSSERTIEHCAACDYTRRAQVHKDAFVTGYHEFQSSAKSSKKSAGGGGRSSRGESLKQQISNRAQSATRPPSTAITDSDNDDDGNAPRCQAKRSDGRICMLQPNHNIHHLSTAMDYHPFVSTAQAAKSSSNQATSGTGKGVVGDAHHAASSGD